MYIFGEVRKVSHGEFPAIRKTFLRVHANILPSKHSCEYTQTFYLTAGIRPSSWPPRQQGEESKADEHASWRGGFGCGTPALAARTTARTRGLVRFTKFLTFSPQVRRWSGRQPPAAKSARWALVGCCSGWPGKGRRPGGAISVPTGAAWAAWPAAS